MFIAAGFLTGAIIAGGLIYFQSLDDRALTSTSDGPTETVSNPGPSRIENLQTAPVNRPVAIDVTLHHREEISALLNKLANMPREPNAPAIALVLHGEEIQFFTRREYDQYKDLVDLAGQLVASQAIEVKVCRTRMGMMGIKEQDLPAYVETVPYGPDEVLRLDDRGYKVYTAF
jgi:hypothetical protein